LISAIQNVFTGLQAAKKNSDLPYQIQQFCADKISTDGSSGKAGYPGQHGQPGGKVIIITNTWDEGNRLTIKVDGGNGGDGSAGGHGTNGNKGSEYPFSKWTSPSATAPHTEHSFNGAAIFNEDLCRRFYDSCVTNEYCEAYGCLGGQGGNGGHGGAKGEGGKSGQVVIVAPPPSNQTDSDHPVLSQKDGSAGSDGIGGQGGIGGRRGDGTWAKIGAAGFFNSRAWENVVQHKESQETSPNGLNGVTGGCNQNQGNPREPTFVLNQTGLMLEYQQFIYSTNSGFFPVSEKLEKFIQNNLPVPALNSIDSTLTYFSHPLTLLENVNLLIAATSSLIFNY